MMRRRKLRHHISDTFLFELDKEEAIYLYLCKEKIDKKHKRLLDEKTKFSSYSAWKSYMVSKYEVYNKDALTEFDRMLNLLLQDSGKMDNFIQCIWTAFISATMAIVLTKALSVQNINVGGLVAILTLCPFFAMIFFLMIYDSYGSESITLLFLKDVKEIVKELIESK